MISDAKRKNRTVIPNGFPVAKSDKRPQIIEDNTPVLGPAKEDRDITTIKSKGKPTNGSRIKARRIVIKIINFHILKVMIV